MKSLASVIFACVFPLATMACTAETGEEVMDDSAEISQSTPAAFETFVGEDGRFYFHLIASNGQIVLHSQGYKSQRSAEAGIKSVLANGVDSHNFAIETSESGEPYFNLVAQNNEIIATSETYASPSNARRAVSAVVKSIANVISDLPVPASKHVAFETSVGDDHKIYFRLRAANGEIVLASQGYSTKAAAEKGILSVRVNGIHEDRFEVFESANGESTYRLKAQNGEIIARGETYASRSNAERAVERISDLIADVPPVVAR